jgi:hypothetical protein
MSVKTVEVFVLSRKEVARPERFELPTLWFEARCSIQLSYGRVTAFYHYYRYRQRTEALGAPRQRAVHGGDCASNKMRLAG